MLVIISLIVLYYALIIVWFAYQYRHAPMLSERCPMCGELGDVHGGDVFTCARCRHVWGL